MLLKLRLSSLFIGRVINRSPTVGPISQKFLLEKVPEFVHLLQSIILTVVVQHT